MTVKENTAGSAVDDSRRALVGGRFAIAAGLRLRFLLLFVGLAIGPILFVGFLLGQAGYSTANLQSQRALDIRALQVRDNIGTFFERSVGELTTLSAIAGPSTFESAKRATAVQSLILRNNSYQDIYILDDRGAVVDWHSRTAVTATADGAHFAEKPIFEIPKTTLRPYLGDIRIDSTVREPLVSLAIPFPDPRTGDLQHMLVANVRFKSIWDLLAGMEREESVDAYVVDSAGRIVAHRNPAVAMQSVSIGPGEAADSRTLAGQEVLSSKKRIHIHGMKLTVVVEQELATAQRFANRFLWTTVSVSTIALIVAVGFFLLYERGVVAPLGRLLTRVDLLRKGQYPDTMDVGGYGEVGMLANSFGDLIGELKSARDQVQESMDNLESRVEERTAELQAMQDKSLRQERLATLGQLTGTVAHEIRNPLGSIASSIYVIKQRCSEAGLDLQATLDRTDRSIKRCDRIITELLDFARARGFQLKATALDSWLSDVLEEQDIPGGITVRTLLQTDGAFVRIDPEELRRAMINVIDNACQAMTDGAGKNGSTIAGELTVASRTNGERVEIAIADTGSGIPEDILPQIFEPLFSTKSFGTGLGLPTVQRIMEEHGGGVDIRSNEGQGTRVTLWLPVVSET